MIKKIIYLIAILSLLFVSEIVYNLFTNPSETYRFLLNRSVKSAISNNFKKSYEYLLLLGKFKRVELSPFPTNKDFIMKYLAYMSDLDAQSIVSFRDNKISMVPYTLGIYAYENGEESLALKFFNLSSKIEPQLSFYRIEMANLDLHSGDKENAYKEIEACLSIKDSYAFCKEYRDNYLDKNIVEDVGFLRESVGIFYQDKL